MPHIVNFVNVVNVSPGRRRLNETLLRGVFLICSRPARMGVVNHDGDAANYKTNQAKSMELQKLSILWTG